MHSSRFKWNTLLAASMLLSQTGIGQTFNVPSSPGLDFPAAGSTPPPNSYYMNVNVGQVSNTAYMTNRSACPGCQINIAGWSYKPGTGGNGGFSYGYTPSGTSFGFTPVGIITINDAVDLQMEYLEDPTGGPGGSSGTGYIVAAYYNDNLDRYECKLYQWTGASSVTLLGTTILSGVIPYNRISIDASGDGTKIALAWSDGSSVYTAAAQLNTTTLALDFSPSLAAPGITFNSLYSCYAPDIAFRKDPVSGNEYLHYVFYDDNGGSGQLSEFKELFSTFYGATTGSYTPSGIDNEALSTLTFVSYIWPHLDCPDISNDEIWGYVYTDDNKTIKFHYLDPSVPSPNSIIVNNGSLSGFTLGADISSQPNFTPVVAFDGDVSRWHIGWLTNALMPYNYAPFAPAYVLVDNSLSLISDADYLTIAPPRSATFQFGVEPLLSFATHNTSMSHLYSTYCASSLISPEWSLFHKLHDVANYSYFKVSGASPDADLKIHPNPFFNTIHINMPASSLEKELVLSVTDILGRNLGSFKGPGRQVNNYLDKTVGKLAPGNYVLTATIGKNTKSVFKIQKIAQ